VPAECAVSTICSSRRFGYGAPYPNDRASGGPGSQPASSMRRGARDRRRGDGLPSSAVFRRFTGDAVAANAGEYTVFSVAYKTAAALDLTRPPLNRDRDRWTDPADYAACQTLADEARTAGVEVLRYESARDRSSRPGVNVALLTCRAFASRKPSARQTWRLYLSAAGGARDLRSPRSTSRIYARRVRRRPSHGGVSGGSAPPV